MLTLPLQYLFIAHVTPFIIRKCAGLRPQTWLLQFICEATWNSILSVHVQCLFRVFDFDCPNLYATFEVVFVYYLVFSGNLGENKIAHCLLGARYFQAFSMWPNLSFKRCPLFSYYYYHFTHQILTDRAGMSRSPVCVQQHTLPHPRLCEQVCIKRVVAQIKKNDWYEDKQKAFEKCILWETKLRVF